MLSDRLLRELIKATPLQQPLITAAWPDLSAESKVDLLASMKYVPDYLVDLALVDRAEIVRYFAARSHYFRRVKINLDLPTSFEVEPAEEARAAKAEADSSNLVRATVDAHGIGLMNLIEQPQLVRLLRIRKEELPDTGGMAKFVEKALASDVPAEEIRDCLCEYFAREDVFLEMNELHVDGGGEFAKTGGWERLWRVAATAPIEVSNLIANSAAMVGKYWSVSQDLLEALPARVQSIVVRRDEAPAEKLRDAIRATPDKYPPEVVKSVTSHDQMIAEFGGFSDEERAAANLEHMPNRLDAVFKSVLRVHEKLDAQAGEPEEAAEKAAQVVADRKLLESVRAAAWIIVVLLIALLWSRR